MLLHVMNLSMDQERELSHRAGERGTIGSTYRVCWKPFGDTGDFFNFSNASRSCRSNNNVS